MQMQMTQPISMPRITLREQQAEKPCLRGLRHRKTGTVTEFVPVWVVPVWVLEDVS